jgi:hypothetical protein
MLIVALTSEAVFQTVPSAVWQLSGVIIASLIAAFYSLVSIYLARRNEVEKLRKNVLIDDCLLPVIRHLSALYQAICRQSFECCKSVLDSNTGVVELAIASNRYSADWDVEYFELIKPLRLDIDNRETSNMSNHAVGVRNLLFKMVCLLEWQVDHLRSKKPPRTW